MTGAHTSLGRSRVHGRLSSPVALPAVSCVGALLGFSVELLLSARQRSWNPRPVRHSPPLLDQGVHLSLAIGHVAIRRRPGRSWLVDCRSGLTVARAERERLNCAVPVRKPPAATIQRGRVSGAHGS